MPWSHALQAHMADRVPYLLGPGRADHAGRRPAASRRRARRSTGSGSPTRSRATRTGASPPAPSSSSTPSPRRSTSSTATSPPDRAARAVDAAARDGLVGDRGAARPAVPPLRARRARPDRDAPRSSRRRARTRPPSRPTWRRSRRSILDEPHDVATHRLEQLIRSYDPCISCATHFLDLTRGGRAMTRPPARIRSSGSSSAATPIAATTASRSRRSRRCCRPCRADAARRGSRSAAAWSCGSRTSSTCRRGVALPDPRRGRRRRAGPGRPAAAGRARRAAGVHAALVAPAADRPGRRAGRRSCASDPVDGHASSASAATGSATGRRCRGRRAAAMPAFGDGHRARAATSSPRAMPRPRAARAPGAEA